MRKQQKGIEKFNESEFEITLLQPILVVIDRVAVLFLQHLLCKINIISKSCL